jgi:hypothetical protein
MSAVLPVDYLRSARRHIKDAHILLHSGRRANAGQLFGFCVECGLKGVLVRAGASVDHEGSVTYASNFKRHLPDLSQQTAEITALPDGYVAGLILGHLPTLAAMHDWKVDHRYWRESATPLATSLGNWELCALEMDAFLDHLNVNGIL